MPHLQFGANHAGAAQLHCPYCCNSGGEAAYPVNRSELYRLLIHHGAHHFSLGPIRIE